MTSSPGWYGPPLDEDHRELQSMLDAFLTAHNVALQDDPESVRALRTELAGLGVWTMGTAETSGGGGADQLMSLLAFERLGRAWPALGWASAQTHAAVDALAGRDDFDELVADLHAGEANVAVVDARSAHVRLSHADGVLSGTVDRVDAAAERPHLLVLTGAQTALVFEPAVLTPEPLRRIGLGGALTRSLEMETGAGQVHELAGVDTDAVLVRLRLGAAAVAAGIAGAAADAALEYAIGREQFGGPLTALPTVRQSLLNQRSTASVIVNAVAAGVTDPVEALAILRAACEGAIETAAAAVQSHGGYGYLVEYPVERYLRDAVSLRAAVDAWDSAIAAAAEVAGNAPPRQEAS